MSRFWTGTSVLIWYCRRCGYVLRSQPPVEPKACACAVPMLPKGPTKVWTA